MSGYEWAVRYAGGHESLWEECRRVLDAGGVAAMSGEVVLWLEMLPEDKGREEGE